MTKPIAPRLKTALLVNRQWAVNDIYAFTLPTGSVLRYTDADQDLTVNGVLYSSGMQIGPYVDTTGNRSRATWKLGIETDTMMLDIVPNQASIAGIAFLVACQQGAFDGAEFKRSRIFMPTFGDTRRGPVPIFVGRVAEVDVGRSKAVFNINSHMELLDQQFPRNLYQPGCVNNLGDAACTVNLTTLAVAGTVLAGSTASLISANLAAFAQIGRFDLGKLTFTSGGLTGFSRTIKTALAGTPGSISLAFNFPATPQAGDTFNLSPGCDKTF